MNNQDNPKPNKIDPVFVSKKERYEVDHFVDHYLTTHRLELNPTNRQTVRELVQQNPEHAPIKREDLTQYVEKNMK